MKWMKSEVDEGITKAWKITCLMLAWVCSLPACEAGNLYLPTQHCKRRGLTSTFQMSRFKHGELCLVPRPRDVCAVESFYL